MNFLAHYYYNHHVRRLEPDPYFVMGVALPDFWARFSRKRRIRWKHVERARPAEPDQVRLRAGLLNHAEVDRRFHLLPCFLQWQRDIRARVADEHVGSILGDFLAHIAVELVMDQRLLRGQPELADTFYAQLEACDASAVELHAGVLAGVNTLGLADIVRAFVARRFLQRYASRDGLVDIVFRVLNLTTVRELPPAATVSAFMARADEVIRPAQVWKALPDD
jgi:hypothetical protein